jgi:hypothetical protein
VGHHGINIAVPRSDVFFKHVVDKIFKGLVDNYTKFDLVLFGQDPGTDHDTETARSGSWRSWKIGVLLSHCLATALQFSTFRAAFSRLACPAKVFQSGCPETTPTNDMIDAQQRV